jgi:phospholipase C
MVSSGTARAPRSAATRKGVRSASLLGVALVAFGLVATAMNLSVTAVAAPGAVPIDPALGIGNIDHVVFVVQENRSFDHYFGTFPGANGIPRTPKGRFRPCIPDPAAKACRPPYHDMNLFDQGGPHGEIGSTISIDHGKMDGYVRSFRAIGTKCTKFPSYYPCRKSHPGPNGTPDVMGFHTAKEIPNYWAYARRYLLQDRMFAPSDSWTLPSHLYLVSAWSATCSNPRSGMSCRSDLKFPGHNVADSGRIWNPTDGLPRPYAWADITWLLNAHHVSWAYYVGPGTCVVAPCHAGGRPQTAVVQNPLPGFRTVAVDHQLHNVQANTKFFNAAAAGSLPSVSWVMPTTHKSEHPPDYIGNGQAWVTRVVNAVMKGPTDQYLHTAIFLTWDDWGGFYDHVKPIRIDHNGYGIRVPGLLISPFARGGVDHQTLSFDAYLKLIEDRFLGGQRLNPRTDGWPDARPTVRENAARLGDLGREFDWTRSPIAPLILDPSP